MSTRVFGKTHPNGQRRVPISDVRSLYPELDIPLSCYHKVGILDVSSGTPVPAGSIDPTNLVTPGQVKVANENKARLRNKAKAKSSKPRGEFPRRSNAYRGGSRSYGIDESMRNLLDDISSGFGCTAPGMAYKHWDD
ncbi:uncharacterized protein SCHCODRAFT_02615338 [Schizophyllum commune H4-8]|uniref:uncharacterized protein n=1 Tax=Schizophyllum commune (strain H4-8 / FGSC 9210) TaxID=578458 RepID=UPI00216011BB|nr:uncharacterized protein SCHCODRAFT_02615338 [Schizophyllum commune H4-8]KAI5896608.1 hypothetical protein SCHCODRAFT_02615338 [Schizophyllum commune H4-8]